MSANNSLLPDRLASLDGLRGLAILLVMLHHETVLLGNSRVGQAILVAGQQLWVGVDLFFALSGFLITRILMASRGSERYFLNFYGRRFLRIAPLYYVLVFFFFVIAPHTAMHQKDSWQIVRGVEWTYWFYLQNFAMAARSAFLHPGLGVSWSLAVEEQFYLLWPILVAICSPKRLLYVVGVLFLIGTPLRWALHGAGVAPLGLYVLMPTHMDAILLGATTCLLLQLFPLTRARALAAWMLPVCLIAAIAVGLFGAFNFDVVQDFAYGMTVFPLLAVAAALVLLTGILRDVDGQKCWIHARFLSYLGRISYGLYLLHSPIRAAIRDRLLLPEQFGKYFGHEVLGQLVFYVVATSASIAAAHLSFYGFERIFLKAQRVFRSPSRESHAAITA